MNDDNDTPISGFDPDGELDDQEQYDEGLDDELDGDEMDDENNVAHLPDGFHIE